MSDTKLRIDVQEMLRSKAPNAKIPRFIVRYLMRIVHQKEINAFLAQHEGVTDFDFLEKTIEFLEVKGSVEGLENIKEMDKPLIFVSNHPLGGLDGMAIALLIGRNYSEKIRILVNDIMMFMTPLKGIFVPVNKTGRQSKSYVAKSAEMYESDNNILTFPAGKCSRKINGKIQDERWHKSFIVNAVKYKRDVVPVYFKGRNSNRFYNLAWWRARLGIKVNIEMLYLSDEMFRQKGKHFVVRFGKPIPWQTFDKSKSLEEWAAWMRKQSYSMEDSKERNR